MYTSCKWIEHGIEFSVNHIKHCCYGENEGGGRPVLLPEYQGEPIDWPALFHEKKKITARHIMGNIYPRCKGCNWLTDKDWNQDEYIDNVIFNHFTKCNCNCEYCYTMEDKQYYNEYKPYPVLPVLSEMRIKNILKDDCYFNFGGGEPTMLPEFEELLQYCLTFARQIDVFSSGIKYSMALQAGLATGKVLLTVSPDAGQRPTYAAVKGVDGRVFDHVWANIACYVKAAKTPMQVRTKYVLIPGVNTNMQDARNFIDLNAISEVKEVMVDIESNYYVSCNRKVDDLLLETAEFMENAASNAGIKFTPCLNLIGARDNV